ncbi:MAG TPA: hypothetical protein VHR42_09330 [Clostridia bacterium]|nr:hypothetical protein [Clostridia bacterium]
MNFNAVIHLPENKNLELLYAAIAECRFDLLKNYLADSGLTADQVGHILDNVLAKGSAVPGNQKGTRRVNY